MRRFISLLVALAVIGLVVVASPVPLLGESLRLVGAATGMASPTSTPTRTATSTSQPAKATPTVEVRVASDGSPQSVSLPLDKLREKQTSTAKSRGAAVELPRRIKIPAIGVDAAFEYVGIAEDGAMDVPKDPQQVAWYRLGPRPGEPGNAILAGHVDWGGKTAVFWRLADLKAGDTVEIVASDQRKYEFVVQWQRWFDADSAPVEEVFRQSDVPEITMVTCGGVFDTKTRQYRSRVVVRAVLRP